MLLHEPGCGRRICGIEHRRSFWSRPRTRTRGLTERAAASRGRDGSLPGSPVADRGGQGTLRRPYLFGKVLTSPSYPLHGDRGPAGVAPNSLRWGFSVPSQADPDRGCDTARRLARTAPCRGLHSAGRLLSSSVPGVPSALALTELDPPRTGRVSGSPTGWIDVRCRKRACIACTPRMQLCVAVGRASSAAPVNLRPVTADTPTSCGISATASVNLVEWQNEYECENSTTTKARGWYGSSAAAPDRW